MPHLAIDYQKCTGAGDCVGFCPIGALELSGNKRWCKAKDSFVSNSEAKEAFRLNVSKSRTEVPLIIYYRMPECILCYQCIMACPGSAIDVIEEMMRKVDAEWKPPAATSPLSHASDKILGNVRREFEKVIFPQHG